MRRISIALLVLFLFNATLHAQDILPRDNGLATYHTQPRYRDSESHPLRIVSYALHPLGWIAREVVFRPFSYFASYSKGTRSFFGYREAFDYRVNDCFSNDVSIPDCKVLVPFNYASNVQESGEEAVVEGNGESESLTQGQDEASLHLTNNTVYFPDVNFNFNSRSLNDLGKGKVRQIADLLNKYPSVNVILEGHTDYIGTDKYNEQLGMDRAKAVKEELVSLGIPQDKLETVTFGESQPIYTDKASWARAVNRRVSVKLK